MPDDDPMASNARRYPRVITMDEITSMPPLEFDTVSRRPPSA